MKKEEGTVRGGEVNEIPNPKPCLSSGGRYSPCDKGKCCTSDCPPCKLSPVVSGGAYERYDVDLYLPGKGLPFEFARYYLSANKNLGAVGV